MLRRPRHRVVHLLLLALLILSVPAPAAAKSSAQAWIRDGSLPLPASCDLYELVGPLEQFFIYYNIADTVSLTRRYPGDDWQPNIAISMPTPTGTAVRTLTDWEQVAAVAKERHAMHERFVLRQVEAAQNGNPWVDLTFDAFREADDIAWRTVGGTAAIDCRAGDLLSLTIGDQERLAVIEPPTIELPDGSPPASACRVAPVPAARLGAIGSAITGAEWSWATTHAPVEVTGGRLVPNDYPAIPSGIATMEEFLACYNAGDLARAAALFTEDFWRQPPTARGEWNGDISIAGLLAALIDISNAPEEPNAQPVIDFVTDVRLLDDGRLSAWVTIAQPGAVFGQIVIFERAGERWLIDAVHHGGLVH